MYYHPGNGWTILDSKEDVPHEYRAAVVREFGHDFHVSAVAGKKLIEAAGLDLGLGLETEKKK